MSLSARVELFDMQGKKILDQELAENKRLSISNLPKGFYLYTMNWTGIRFGIMVSYSFPE